MARRPLSAFSGRAHFPAYQPVVDALVAFCKERQITANELGRMVYGTRPDGSNVNTTTVYKLMHGKQGLTPETAQLIKQKTGLDLLQLAQSGNGMRRSLAVAAVKKVKPSARRALVAFNQAAAADKQPEQLRAAKAPPRFALVVQQDGSASMTMNLFDVDADTALRAFDAMKAIGLVKSG